MQMIKPPVSKILFFMNAILNGIFKIHNRKNILFMKLSHMNMPNGNFEIAAWTKVRFQIFNRKCN